MADTQTILSPAADASASLKDSAAATDAESAPLSLFRLPKFFTQGSEINDADAFDEESDDFSDGAGRKVRSADELNVVHSQLERLTEQVAMINERESALERVFDTLHSELSDYKNDFLYEHLKPVVRPLLFLYDSMEQFESEVSVAQVAVEKAAAESETTVTASSALAPETVRENVSYFRDQLIEALRVCEVTIMDTPNGAFNAKLHKAVDVVAVSAEQDGTIVRVVRSGWFLNGQLLRPSEVVVGKYRSK